MAALARALGRGRSGGTMRAIARGRGFSSAQSFPSEPESSPGTGSSKNIGSSRLWKWMKNLLECPETDVETLAKRKILNVRKGETLSKIRFVDLNECLEMVDSAKDEEKSFQDFFCLGKLYTIQGSADKVLLCAEKAAKLVPQGSVFHALCLHLEADGFFLSKDYAKCMQKLKLVLELLDKDEDETAELIRAETEIRVAEVLVATRKFQEALPLFLSSIAKKEKLCDDKRAFVDDYIHTAEALVELGRYPEAAEQCRKALDSAEDGTFDEARSRRLLGVVYRGLKQLPKSIEELKVVKELALKHGRNEDARWIELELAQCYMDSEKYEEAKEVLNAVLDDEEVRGRLKGFAHACFARICVLENEADEAIAHTEEASMILRKNKGVTLKDAETFAELATFFEAVKDYDSAIDHFEEAQRIYVNFPEAVTSLAETYARVGHIYLVMEKSETAVSILGRGVKLIEDKIGIDHPDLGDMLNTMGVANLGLKNLVLASGQFERAKVISVKHFGTGHPNTVAATINMVTAYSSLNRWDKAIKCQTEVVKHLEEQKAQPEVLEKHRDTLQKLQLIQENAATVAHSAGIS
ncbi:hypothetical protein SELMODRAFT_439259 [Selaginella moellendorffii]|uniref:Uncharacterized protein n=1 Tax=Selaginella moellendorffii TaxID=88036 RepID=D8R357_SELML|nr:uncharacterized protein LOC9634015 [Selaginella moellendorffii]EFJ33222.1 hypothetical protein SELMODRAFT_439259 [Selaginella moellendorffii]|eukprot:XP_002965802.1 uncharacterized protein LOC9634015 [Selaginella moellendorffii]